MSDDAVIGTNKRLDEALRALARGPAADRGKPVLITVVAGDWLSTYEIRLVTVKPKPRPKGRGRGLIEIHPKRSAPGK